jgi:hypothetical protein
MLYIKLRINIEKPLKAEVKSEDWKNVSTINNLSQSLFKQVDLIIGDRAVTQSHQTYAFKCDLETKLGISKEAKESFLTGALWYADDPEAPDGINTTRSSFISPSDDEKDKTKGRELDLMAPIYLDMFTQDRALLGGCNIKLKFIPNDPSFYMMCATPVRVTSVEFTDATLFIHKSKISRPVLDGHLKALEVSNAKYMINKRFIVSSTITKGTMDIILDNIHNGILPRRAFVVFLSHNAYNGSYALNPFNYQHFNLTYLAFYQNGVQYPEKAFQPDFKNGKYIREYLSMFEATNQTISDSCITIDRKSYAKGNTIIGVNFAPDLSTGCCSSGHVNRQNFGHLRLAVRFSEPLKETINVLTFMEFDSLIEINQGRNPLIEIT